MEYLQIILAVIIVIIFQVLLTSFKDRSQAENAESNTDSKKNYNFLRKFQHSSTALIILFLNEFLDPMTKFLSISSGVLFILSHELIRFNDKKYNNLFISLFQNIIRKEEREEKYLSAFYFLLGTFILVCLFDEKVISLALLCVGFGDPAASLFGLYFNKSKVVFKEKSVAGFLGCFYFCHLAAEFYFLYKNHYNTQQSFYKGVFLHLEASLLIGLVGGLSDFISGFFSKLDDNLTIQVCSGFMIASMKFFVQI